MLAYKLGLESTTHCFEFSLMDKIILLPKHSLDRLSNCFASFKTDKKKKISFRFETESQKVKDKGLFERERETHLRLMRCWKRLCASTKA